MKTKIKLAVSGTLVTCILILGGIYAYNSDDFYLSDKVIMLTSLPETFYGNSTSTLLLVGKDLNGNPLSYQDSVIAYAYYPTS